MTAQTIPGDVDVVVVGGGLAGLACTVTAARAGLSVVLLEKARHVGGRGASYEDAGFSFNLGPHALYRQGAGARVLADLGVRFTGGMPGGGAWLLHNGERHLFPRSVLSMLRTTAISLRGRLATAQIVRTLQRVDPRPLDEVSVEDWLARQPSNPEARAFARAFVRLSTYANDPQHQSAGAALAQVQLGLAGRVLYIDGGWQTLIEELRRAAIAAGARIVHDCRADEVVINRGTVHGLNLASGDPIRAAQVVLSVPPQEAARLLGDAAAPLTKVLDAARPARAACLNVGLSRLPNTECLFALGLDEPVYFSVHSHWAKFGPPGTALIQVARYLEPGIDLDPGETRRQLEGVLDLMQPGWRDLATAERFFPGLLVVPRIDLAQEGGVAGRPNVEFPGINGLLLAGDWVGSEGMLADTALASGWRAARSIIAKVVEPRHAVA